MRDAIGGTFIIKLILIFIVISVSFMAFAVQYAKAFRVKNLIINKLEQYQYDGTVADANVLDDIAEDLGKIPYNIKNIGNNSCNGTAKFITSDQVGGQGNVGGGYCLEKKGNDKEFYYRVTTYITAEFSFFDIVITIPITGETKIIYSY